MQNNTGCKINVAQPSGQDYEREIGLVGTRSAIELAKRAIMEKVHAVVSTHPFVDPLLPLTNGFRRRRTDQEQELVGATIHTKIAFRTSRPSDHHPVATMDRHLRRMRHPKKAQQIPTLRMVARLIIRHYGPIIIRASQPKDMHFLDKDHPDRPDCLVIKLRDMSPVTFILI